MAETAYRGSRHGSSHIPAGPGALAGNPAGKSMRKNFPAKQTGVGDAMPEGREFRPAGRAADRYCLACRGPHDPSKEHNPQWEPYSIRARMIGLGTLETHFYGAARTGRLPVKLDGLNLNKILWTQPTQDGAVLTPARMEEKHFVEFLPLMLEGCREQHEPHRYLAFEAAKELIDNAGPLLLPCVPHVVRPMSLGLQTMEPNLVATQIVILKRMLAANKWMPRAFLPHLKKILPILTMYRYRHDLEVVVPPPMCTASTGSRSGRGRAPDEKKCGVCGVDLNPGESFEAVKAAAEAKGFEAPRSDPRARKKTFRTTLSRPFTRHIMSELVMDTFDMIEAGAGRGGLQQIRKFVPSWGIGAS